MTTLSTQPSSCILVPWDTDFLQHLVQLVLERTGNEPGKALILFPNDRAGRYFIHYLRNLPFAPKPCLVPKILSINETFTALRAEIDTSTVPGQAGLLDQVALLSLCVRTAAATNSKIDERLKVMDDAAFFPWGVRLAKVMDECFLQGLTPMHLSHTDGEVEPFAAALLASLGQLFALYQEALLQHNLTTPGFDAFRTMTLHEQASDKVKLFPLHEHVFIAGFNALSGTEEWLFQTLWQQGAHICLHTDPRLASDPKNAHWSCEQQRQWIEHLKAECVLACAPSGHTPRLHFFSGYDLHSQLAVLQQDMSTVSLATPTNTHGDTAIVLPSSESLLPVLHHLPDRECNISMGYPLEHSQLFQLLHSILELRSLSEHTQQDDDALRVHWRPLLDIVRSPLLRMLSQETVTLRPFLRTMEQLVCQGSRYVHLEHTIAQARALSGHAEAAALFEQVIENTLRAWFFVTTPHAMGCALTALCETLLEYGKDVWKNAPLDAECLFRIMQRVAPLLRNNLLATTALPWMQLKSMLHELLLAERVPFEADPITGLQVLGMLETRLLTFRHVFLVDATDDRLPGVSERSPLLPDSLRTILGLPDNRLRENVVAHTLHALLAGATDVYLYWQEGVQTSAIFDSKKQRSRFIEELIWREELQQKAIYTPGTHPLRAATPIIIPPKRDYQAIERTQAMQAAMQTMLCSSLYPTAIDVYITCPLRFYFQYICRLRPAAEVNEEDDPAAVGTILHNTLKQFYTPHLGKDVARQDLDAAELIHIFEQELKTSAIEAALPPESAAMLRVAGPERLTRYLENQPEKTRILHLEQAFTTPFATHGKTLTLAGVLDRVDMRRQGAVILDYKTGRIKTLSANFWQADFWNQMSQQADNPQAAIFHDPLEDILPMVGKALGSVQLPWYMYVYDKTGEKSVADAAFVELALDGREKGLLHEDTSTMEHANSSMEHEDATKATNLHNHVLSHQIPLLLRFLTGHMLACPEFRPQNGRHCDWCLWKNLCIL